MRFLFFPENCCLGKKRSFFLCDRPAIFGEIWSVIRERHLKQCFELCKCGRGWRLLNGTVSNIAWEEIIRVRSDFYRSWSSKTEDDFDFQLDFSKIQKLFLSLFFFSVKFLVHFFFLLWKFCLCRRVFLFSFTFYFLSLIIFYIIIINICWVFFFWVAGCDAWRLKKILSLKMDFYCMFQKRTFFVFIFWFSNVNFWFFYFPILKIDWFFFFFSELSFDECGKCEFKFKFYFLFLNFSKNFGFIEYLMDFWVGLELVILKVEENVVRILIVSVRFHQIFVLFDFFLVICYTYLFSFLGWVSFVSSFRAWFGFSF